MNKDLTFMSATELRQLITDRELSPVELTEHFLDRIDTFNPQLSAYLTVSSDVALSAAAAAEQAVVRGDDLGELHGIPISVKDLENTADIRTTAGSLIFKDRVPQVDSVVVQRIKAAGAVILGKTNTPEFGLSGHTQNHLGDHCRNPWDISRTTGGSSGGAGASLASGLCSLATGSDGGGSIRIPASFCGVYGIKPTQGRVPIYAGVTAPLSINLFSQPGPMSRTVRDSAVLLRVLAGHDHRDVGSLRDAPQDYRVAPDLGVSGIRIGWSPDFGFASVDRQVLARAYQGARVFEDLGCFVEDLDPIIDEPWESFWQLFSAVAAARYQSIVEGKEELLTDYARECINNGKNLSASDYVYALGKRTQIKRQFDSVFERYDLLISPTMPVDAFTVGEPPVEIDGVEVVDQLGGYIPFTYPINMIGYPAASVPCGFTERGMPVGLQITGRWGDESTVIAASAAFEEARPWTHHRPMVS